MRSAFSPIGVLSVVVPLYDEAASVDRLLGRLRAALAEIDEEVELILVDDGSRDETAALLRDAATKDQRLVVLELLTNYGQVGALSAGMCYARGDVVVALDGDLQNDPAEIGGLLACVRAGHDLVGGIRVRRRDRWHRRGIGRLVRTLTRPLTGVAIRDLGCSLKAYHRDVVEMLRDGDGVVQFNTVAAFRRARFPLEIPVAHARRTHGRSKWDLLAKIAFVVDLAAASAARPLCWTMLAGFAAGLFGVGLYAAHLLGLTTGVLAMSAPASILLHGLTVGLLGLAGQVLVRTLQAARGEPAFRVKRVWPPERGAAPDLPNLARPLYDREISFESERTWRPQTASSCSEPAVTATPTSCECS